ncbi:hypothetical protein L2E82_39982 [Cichorium intybus]|uniref:Uncharacterized protein n=1 Tax=Cichorium intybus TaxID=13427 RepID=A0ACB9ALG7_CICIN|nr:hypothetical protein L2E82_39982 [Cichorium intybus]
MAGTPPLMATKLKFIMSEIYLTALNLIQASIGICHLSSSSDWAKNPLSISLISCEPSRKQFPIIYHVHHVRDGNSFATRRIDAIQKGTIVFTMIASFQV